jgi:hypothetical protein
VVLANHFCRSAHERPELSQPAAELVGCFEPLDLRYAGTDIYHAINQVEQHGLGLSLFLECLIMMMSTFRDSIM